MAYALIVFVVLLIVGPILMLRPTPRERRETRIREQAMKNQVTIQPISLQRNKKFNALLQRNPHIDEHHWYRYQMIAKDDKTGPNTKGEWVQRKAKGGELVWESVDVHQSTPKLVASTLLQWHQQQCVDFLSLELGPRSVSIIWNERGDRSESEALCTLLKSLMEV